MPVRLCQRQSNYSNIERELLGVVFAVTHFKHFTYGRPVTIISDHKLLVSLFKKSLTSSSPCLSRMLLQILDYDLNIVYQEGSKMHLSDTISRLSTHQPDKGSTLTGMDITVHKVESCTNFSSVSLGKIRELTLHDNDLQVLKTHIINGFPNHTNQCPEYIRPFFPYRDELTIFNGLILKGSHIVIPTVLQDQLLNVIHQSHLGICKTLEHARTSIFWPNITNDIKKLLSQCRACVQHHVRYCVPKFPHSSTTFNIIVGFHIQAFSQSSYKDHWATAHILHSAANHIQCWPIGTLQA